MHLRMDNPETLTTLGTQEARRRQTKQKIQCRKLTKLASLTPPKSWGESSCSRWVSSFCFLKDTCHVTHKVNAMIMSMGGGVPGSSIYFRIDIYPRRLKCLKNKLFLLISSICVSQS